MATYLYKGFNKIPELVLRKQQFELYSAVQFTEQSLEENFNFFNDKIKSAESVNRRVAIISSITFLICLMFVIYYQTFNFQIIPLMIFVVCTSFSSVFLIMIFQGYTIPRLRKETMYRLKILKKWKELRKETVKKF